MEESARLKTEITASFQNQRFRVKDKELVQQQCEMNRLPPLSGKTITH